MPDSVNVSDTLGWIYYKHAAYHPAIELLVEWVKRSRRTVLFIVILE
jgi:hypothetical protein